MAAWGKEEIAEWHVVEDGGAVLEYLDGEGEFSDRNVHPFPDVVVLDLKMPLMNGLEVLTWIKNKSAWPRLPVMLLSGSGLEKDVEEAYRCGANAYFQKPYSLAELKKTLRAIVDFWSLCQRPNVKGQSVAPPGNFTS